MRITALAVLALAGCALFPVEEAACRGAQEKGYRDGYGGHPQQYSRMRPECQERYGVLVAEAEYFKGWDAGYDEWYRLIGSRMKAN